MNIVCQIMRIEHLNEGACLFQECFKQEPWNEDWTIKQAYQRLIEMLDNPSSKGFVVYNNDNEMIALALGRVMTYLNYKEFSLDEFCVSKSCQGHGIGSQVMKFLKAELKKDNITCISLNTIKGKLSYGFYAKNGFEIKETHVFMSCSLL